MPMCHILKGLPSSNIIHNESRISGLIVVFPHPLKERLARQVPDHKLNLGTAVFKSLQGIIHTCNGYPEGRTIILEELFRHELVYEAGFSASLVPQDNQLKSHFYILRVFI